MDEGLAMKCLNLKACEFELNVKGSKIANTAIWLMAISH